MFIFTWRDRAQRKVLGFVIALIFLRGFFFESIETESAPVLNSENSTLLSLS
jgi:hypothetical protein